MIFNFKAKRDFTTDDQDYEAYKKTLKKEKKLTGDDIRQILLKNIPKQYLIIMERNARSINESPFDLAVGEKETLEMTGFEIKGDTDNFSRLKSQLQHYTTIFDKVYLVLHKKNAPEWLPSEIGILRVNQKEEIILEQYPYGSLYEEMDIGSVYEFEALMRENGIGKNISKKIKETLGELFKIRKNVLFNRFFAVAEGGYGSYKFETFYPLTEKQKRIFYSFDVEGLYRTVSKDLEALEKKLNYLKELSGKSGTQKKL